MEIISKLKYSHKGQLNYERDTNFIHLYDDLQKCAFPPLGKFSNFYHHSDSTDLKKIERTDNCKNNFDDHLVIKKSVSSNSSSSSSKGCRTMPILSVEYLHRKMAILEYEALWDKKIKQALKKKMWEFYENDKILHQKMELALKDYCKQEAFRENSRYEEFWQKELADRYEEHQKETVYSKFQVAEEEKRKEPKSSRKEEKETQHFDWLQNRRKNFYSKTNRFRKC